MRSDINHGTFYSTHIKSYKKKVPGVIGVLQALEATRIITDMCGNIWGPDVYLLSPSRLIITLLIDNKPNMLLFSAGSAHMFRTVKLRGRKQDCVICGDNPSITQLVDYVEFCGASATDKVGIPNLPSLSLACLIPPIFYHFPFQDTSLNLLGPDDRIAVQVE